MLQRRAQQSIIMSQQCTTNDWEGWIISNRFSWEKLNFCNNFLNCKIHDITCRFHKNEWLEVTVYILQGSCKCRQFCFGPKWHAIPTFLKRLKKSLNPLSPNSDQHQFSPNNISRSPRVLVMRITKLITKGRTLWS